MVGLPDERLRERNCLCLGPRRGETATLQDFVVFLKDWLSIYKLPERRGICNGPPLTQTGKLQRRVLVAQVLARGDTAGT